MRTSRRVAVAAALLFVLAVLPSSRGFPPLASADDKKPPEAPPGDKPPATKEVPLKVLTDAEAAPLLEGLRKAAKTRNGIEATPALDAIGGKTHPEFEPLLSKLLLHLSSDVAVRAANAMGERASPKTASRLWAGWLAPVTRERYDVKAAILGALGKLKAPLDAKQYDEIANLWKQAPSDAALSGIAAYFGAMKTDKRPCRIFAEFLNEPKAGVNDGTNPPAAYWEAKWKQWKEVFPSVQDALKSITGQVFDHTDEAKTWFKAHEKDFGFVW